MAKKSKKNMITGYEHIDLKQWNGPPYSYSVKVNGTLKKMQGFDEDHIRAQLYPRKPKMIRRVKDDN